MARVLGPFGGMHRGHRRGAAEHRRRTYRAPGRRVHRDVSSGPRWGVHRNVRRAPRGRCCPARRARAPDARRYLRGRISPVQRPVPARRGCAARSGPTGPVCPRCWRGLSRDRSHSLRGRILPAGVGCARGLQPGLQPALRRSRSCLADAPRRRASRNHSPPPRHLGPGPRGTSRSRLAPPRANRRPSFKLATSGTTRPHSLSRPPSLACGPGCRLSERARLFSPQRL